MSRNTKIILVVLSTLALICVLLCVAVSLLMTRAASSIATKDPVQMKKVAAQIADYTLPPGYQELMGTDLLFEKIAMIGPGPDSDEPGVSIMLLQVTTANTNQAQMEEQMRQAFAGQFRGNQGFFEHVDERTVTIKGKPTVLSISEADMPSGTLRQATGVFSGKGGLAMVMITGSVDEWDWKMLDDFFQSIH